MEALLESVFAFVGVAIMPFCMIPLRQTKMEILFPSLLKGNTMKYLFGILIIIFTGCKCGNKIYGVNNGDYIAFILSIAKLNLLF